METTKIQKEITVRKFTQYIAKDLNAEGRRVKYIINRTTNEFWVTETYPRTSTHSLTSPIRIVEKSTLDALETLLVKSGEWERHDHD